MKNWIVILSAGVLGLAAYSPASPRSQPLKWNSSPLFGLTLEAVGEKSSAWTVYSPSYNRESGLSQVVLGEYPFGLEGKGGVATDLKNTRRYRYVGEAKVAWPLPEDTSVTLVNEAWGDQLEVTRKGKQEIELRETLGGRVFQYRARPFTILPDVKVAQAIQTAALGVLPSEREQYAVRGKISCTAQTEECNLVLAGQKAQPLPSEASQYLRSHFPGNELEIEILDSILLSLSSYRGPVVVRVFSSSSFSGT